MVRISIVGKSTVGNIHSRLGFKAGIKRTPECYRQGVDRFLLGISRVHVLPTHSEKGDPLFRQTNRLDLNIAKMNISRRTSVNIWRTNWSHPFCFLVNDRPHKERGAMRLSRECQAKATDTSMELQKHTRCRNATQRLSSNRILNATDR